jgi:hypothetical protein
MTKRQIRIEGDIAYVPLTQGYEAVIDAADVPLVEGYSWKAVVGSRRVYAATQVGGRKNKTDIRMHRLIMEAPTGVDVDHIDHNGINNRRKNMRLCTRSENLQNQRKRLDNTSGFKGVNYYKRTGRWRAYIMRDSKERHLGYFDTPEEAYDAYCKASEELHGEYGFAG